MCADEQRAFQACIPFAGIAKRISGDVQDLPPGNRSLDGFKDFEALGLLSYHLNQRLVSSLLSILFTGEEYQPNLFRILAGGIGGDLDEPW